MSSSLFPLPLLVSASVMLASGGPQEGKQIPPSWQVLPIPRDADYGATDDFLTLGRAAIVRRGAYQTVRDGAGELVGESTITEGELVRILGGIKGTQLFLGAQKLFGTFIIILADTFSVLGTVRCEGNADNFLTVGRHGGRSGRCSLSRAAAQF